MSATSSPSPIPDLMILLDALKAAGSDDVALVGNELRPYDFPVTEQGLALKFDQGRGIGSCLTRPFEGWLNLLLARDLPALMDQSIPLGTSEIVHDA